MKNYTNVICGKCYNEQTWDFTCALDTVPLNTDYGFI